ncbi:MAG: hypothetical protein HY908_21465 [Myxococcales bacterium]|nr:hypothetical protein [Myxococcales bacterium]
MTEVLARRGPLAAGCSVLLGLAGAAGVARADDPPAEPPVGSSKASSDAPSGGPTRTLDEHSWRRRSSDKKQSLPKWFAPTHFLFALRFGPYYPEIDDEFGGAATPYADVFGKKGLFYFGLELDWLPFRVPYLGSIGIAAGWGWTHTSATAKISGTDQDSGADTGLTIMPMNFSGALFFDGPLREYTIPVVPYVKLGVGLGYWTTSGATGTSEVDGVKGEGLSPGLHFALGAAIALNAFDASSATALQEQVGIANAFLYGEWMRDVLDGIGSTPVMEVGTSTGIVGLAIDF